MQILLVAVAVLALISAEEHQRRPSSSSATDASLKRRSRSQHEWVTLLQRSAMARTILIPTTAEAESDRSPSSVHARFVAANYRHAEIGHGVEAEARSTFLRIPGHEHFGELRPTFRSVRCTRGKLNSADMVIFSAYGIQSPSSVTEASGPHTDSRLQV